MAWSADVARPLAEAFFGNLLLGLVLERASGLPYEKLITDRLLTPLGMSRTGVGSNAGGIPLPGHDHRGELPHWQARTPARPARSRPGPSGMSAP